MSPEYAMYGKFSEKSDVFSFGVIVLEIVTGKRNRGFNNLNYEHNLLNYVSITTNSSICFLDCSNTLNAFILLHRHGVIGRKEER